MNFPPGPMGDRVLLIRVYCTTTQEILMLFIVIWI